MSPTLVTQRLAFAAGKTAVRKAIASPILQPFLGAPVLLHSCKPRQRPRHSNSQQQDSAAQQQQAAPPRRQQPRKGVFRRLKLLCVSTVRALPAAGIKAAVLGGVQHLSSVTAFAGLSGAVIAGVALGVAGKGVRRWQAGRRAAKRTMATAHAGAATDVTILSFNIRGVSDRWPERAPVLKKVLKQADADVICFQEVLTGEFRQEQLLLGSSYTVHECRAALQSVRSSGFLGAALSSVLSALLGVSWIRSLLVSLPESVEGWRERNKVVQGWARLLKDITVVPFYGNSIATRVPAITHSNSSSSSTCWPPFWCGSSSNSGDGSSKAAATAAGDILVLGDFRAAQRVCLKLKPSRPTPSSQQQQQQQQYSQQELEGLIQQQLQDAGDRSLQQQQQQGDGVVDVWLVNTHLDHASPEIRARQMQAICSWVAPLKSTAGAIVITGDLNAPPDEQLHDVASCNGFASSHKVAHGSEPPFTWPSGIIAPLMDEGEPHCADYIYVWQAATYQLQVLDAQLCGDRPTEGDSTLYPSDHIGLKVTLRITPRSNSSNSSAAAGLTDALPAAAGKEHQQDS